ncbi:MAG: hypothetical protein P8184_16980 [Calditrichia bacterium]
MNKNAKEKTGSTQKDAAPPRGTLFRFLTPILATLIASLVATYVTYSYNERQMLLARIEALDKYREYINSQDAKTREYGFFVFEELGYSELVNKLAEVRDDPAALKVLLYRLEEKDVDTTENSKTAQIADKIMRQAIAPKQEEAVEYSALSPSTSKKVGWIYLGHYVSEKEGWKTRYLNFAPYDKPSALVGREFEVREETGSLNIRIGMPTAVGQFQQVRDVLKVGSKVKIQEYNAWQSTGYIWAKIEYSP